MNLEPYFTPYSKINSRWVKNLKVKVRILKLLEENIFSTSKQSEVFFNKAKQKHKTLGARLIN